MSEPRWDAIENRLNLLIALIGIQVALECFKVFSGLFDTLVSRGLLILACVVPILYVFRKQLPDFLRGVGGMIRFVFRRFRSARQD